MWQKKWREEIWSAIDRDWDVIIIGGGITGAGILREVTRLGLHALLIEQKDFAWGTSSRSSKLVHGGLRYLKEGKFRLTRASVHEREQLLKDGPGLIEPIDFLLANYEDDKAGRITYGMGLTIYDLLAFRWSHRYYSPQDFRLMAGQITPTGLEGGYRYGDAQTDDARLVLRVIREAVAAGGTAINYVKATKIIRDDDGNIARLEITDQETGQRAEIQSRVFINATGAWADNLRKKLGRTRRIRPLRGSHLIIPNWRLPVSQAITFAHPIDQRPVFLFPWEGITLVGTTDVDWEGSLDIEPGITPAEVAYLLTAIEARYPLLNIGLEDIISTYAGVRPVLDSGKENPSEESRDHVIWEENGLITVTGGKLTTFRLIAFEVIKKAAHYFDDLAEIDEDAPILAAIDLVLEGTEKLPADVKRRICGHYGTDAQALIDAAQSGEMDVIPGTAILWAELRWAARAEGVIHLDDLLLRRLRLGLLVSQGGKAHFERIRSICQPELGWDDARWEAEAERYFELYKCCYSLPNRSLIPDWRTPKTDKSKIIQDDGIKYRTPIREMGSRVLIAFLFFTSILMPLLIFLYRRRGKSLGESFSGISLN